MEEIFVKYIQPYLPDFFVRFIIKIGIWYTNLNDRNTCLNNEQNFVKTIRSLPKATYDVDKANEQHYEFPTEFFKIHLGNKLKYSSCE